jgi:hypothetical protein
MRWFGALDSAILKSLLMMLSWKMCSVIHALKKQTRLMTAVKNVVNCIAKTALKDGPIMLDYTLADFILFYLFY